MKHLAKYMLIFKISIQDGLAYVADFLGRSFFFVLIIGVYLLLWKNIYANQPVMEGFTLNKMIWYLIITEIITLSAARFYTEIADDVKTGNIAYMLNKPYDYMGYQLANAMGKSMLWCGLNGVIGILMGLLFVGPLEEFRWVNLPAMVLSILMGILIDFMIMYALALTAFWVEENLPFRWIYQKLVFTLGGMLLPLDLFPVSIAKVAHVLPFAYVTYAPAKLVVQFEMPMFAQTIAIQGLYLLVSIVVGQLIYRKGVGALNVNGG